MPSQAEELIADRDRYRHALEGLIAEQSIVVQRLEHDLAVGRTKLDRLLLKLVLFSQQFGRGSTDTAIAQRETEDANTPVVELTTKLHRERAVLAAYQQKLVEFESGQLMSPAEALT
jgi:uncharacterized coiled-coil protein SlyX